MIYGKPEITKDMGSKRFLEFYYIESEMAKFCKENGLSPEGGRIELRDRIVNFLNGGNEPASKFMQKEELDLNAISDNIPIEKELSFSTAHSDYFFDAIGSDFIPYEDFIIWLEENPGKTYGEAVRFWYLLHDDLSV